MSLRVSIEKVFKKTPGLEKIEIMSPLGLGGEPAQGVLPADLPPELLSKLANNARALRHHQLQTQMRVQAVSDFVRYVRWIPELDPLSTPPVPRLDGYGFRIFDDFDRMRKEIFQHDSECCLSRMAAGYARDWVTKLDKKTKLPRGEFGIDIGETRLRWNIQGYDLNYAGVIIGLDLRYDPQTRRLHIDGKSYFEKRGRQNNNTLGKAYSDGDLLRYITQEALSRKG
ncbi:hypothetical protein B0T26DRAFT_675301 [Lasiosphaeria miniovina]|uniref:Schlafen group 3-like DNA/RNA helicase domain-containing protein n=1 Tax=Lasiosphaeria miniovina TaxID=1954250 RepID=A0AA40AJD4_9PEZI|nr:uncharacterized protein B0T26DRAFT_675301 [Lasiosphaeria miniovina]KAK0716892.1 hypothetical protein B0T26DRAFT_675301 [Lasiosphaeria miniovina]